MNSAYSRAILPYYLYHLQGVPKNVPDRNRDDLRRPLQIISNGTGWWWKQQIARGQRFRSTLPQLVRFENI